MSTRTKEEASKSLQLPEPFEDLTGVISADLKVIATALAQRAGDRLLLQRRHARELQAALLNNLTQIINETMESLTVERH